jgi:hypothetical protein
MLPREFGNNIIRIQILSYGSFLLLLLDCFSVLFHDDQLKANLFTLFFFF